MALTKNVNGKRVVMPDADEVATRKQWRENETAKAVANVKADREAKIATEEKAITRKQAIDNLIERNELPPES